MNHSVIVLNADYTYLNTVSWKDAVCLIFKGHAEIIKESVKKVKTVITEYVLPEIIRLIKQVRALYGKRVPWSKHNIFIRDKFTCQYCGKKIGKPQLEHVIPRSRGGKTNFENCVAACHDCNQKKGNKLPREAGMSLLRNPYQPTIMEFFHAKMEQLGIKEKLKFLA